MTRVLAICILAAPGLLAQSTVTGSRTVQGSWDASGASATKPAKAGATLPGSCFSGEFFFNTAAGSGQNVYLCNPNNTWSPTGGGVTSVFGRTGAVTAATGDYLAAQVTNAADQTGSYSNPVWISSLAWGKLTGIPLAFAPTSHNLLSAAHGDTTVASVTRGALITGQGASPTWSILALGAVSHFLRSNGTDLIYSAGPAAGAGACSAGQVMTAGNSDAAPTCSAPAYSWLTGVPAFYYQNVQSNASNQTQRANLNFSNQFSLTDSAANNSTTITLAATIGANTTGNATTATALASAPSQCGANNFSTGVAASGNANCAQPSAANLSNGTTGSGAAVLATSPALVTPNLGTPSAINLANATGAPTWNQSTTGNAATATALAAAPSQCGANNFSMGVAASGSANCAQPGFSNLSGTAVAGQIPANVRARAIGSSFSGGGGALTAGLVNYFTVPFACTVSAWSMTVDTGTIAIDVWKVATGTAIPTVSNTITASAVPAISTGTAFHSATVTGWTTSVAANDIFAFNIKAASGPTVASIVLECDQ
jgi:hypothetical protein